MFHDTRKKRLLSLFFLRFFPHQIDIDYITYKGDYKIVAFMYSKSISKHSLPSSVSTILFLFSLYTNQVSRNREKEIV